MTWSPYKATAESPWNLRRAVHLHRRAGFAAPWTTLQRDLEEGHEASISRILNGNVNDKSMGREGLTKAIGDAAVGSSNPQRLKAWWLQRMLNTKDPLGERLTLMWHNHFATSNRKVKSLPLMRGQNEIFLQHGRAPFGELLAATVKHPAMMIWLDGDSNRKGKANENLARELLELFTLGVGNYSERDVKESARALTGWTVINDQFENRKTRHDDGELTILGKTQPFDGDQLLDLLLKHPATAKRVAWRICKTFMGENVVDKAAMEQLAKGLVANQMNISWAVETVLRSELFFSDANIRSKVIGPAENIVGTIRCLELDQSPPSTMILADWIQRMGLDLFYPPNVGGWNEGRSWLGSRMVIARANFATALSSGDLWHPSLTPDLDQLATGHGAADDLESKVNWLCQLLMGEASKEMVNETIAAVKESNPGFATAAATLLCKPESLLG